jgi:hypothetical protein
MMNTEDTQFKSKICAKIRLVQNNIDKKYNQLIFIVFFELTTPCIIMAKVAKKSTLFTFLNTHCAKRTHKIIILASYAE